MPSPTPTWVHVGEVNTYRFALDGTHAGAESCDGTGWFRGDQAQLQGAIEIPNASGQPRLAEISHEQDQDAVAGQP